MHPNYIPHVWQQPCTHLRSMTCSQGRWLPWARPLTSKWACTQSDTTGHQPARRLQIKAFTSGRKEEYGRLIVHIKKRWKQMSDRLGWICCVCVHAYSDVTHVYVHACMCASVCVCVCGNICLRVCVHVLYMYSRTAVWNTWLLLLPLFPSVFTKDLPLLLLKLFVHVRMRVCVCGCVFVGVCVFRELGMSKKCLGCELRDIVSWHALV